MGLTVWKYPVTFRHDLAEVEMVRDARLLHADGHGQAVEVWALVNPDEERREHRRLRIAGTGHPLDDTGAGVHVATWRDGPYVWHLFDLGSVEDAERLEALRQANLAALEEEMERATVVDTRAPFAPPATSADGTPPA